MKKNFALFILVIVTNFVYSQSNVIDFIKAGKDDAKILFENYLDPYASALGEGLNNGWFQTAETHKFLGFDFSFNISAISIPESDQYFELDGLGLANIELVTPGSGPIPTVAGPDKPGSKLRVFREANNPSSEELLTFDAPEGSGLDVVPVPMAQISFGLLPHTDLIGRYVPELEFSGSDDDVKVGLKGIGLKHNFTNWVPFLKKLPVDAALFFTYAQVNAETGFNFTSEDYNVDLNADFIDDQFTFKDDQRLEFDTRAMKYGLILSKKLGVLTVFGSIGNNETETNIDLLGHYPLLEDGGTEVVIKSEKDPLRLDMGSSSNIAYNGGLRLRLGFFKLYASVNRAAYTSYNAGIGLGLN